MCRRLAAGQQRHPCPADHRASTNLRRRSFRAPTRAPPSPRSSICATWPSVRPQGGCRAVCRCFAAPRPLGSRGHLVDTAPRPSPPRSRPPPHAGSGLVLLVLTALGWRLPIRVHMVLQAAMVGTWIHFGTGPHCRNQVGAGAEEDAGPADGCPPALRCASRCCSLLRPAPRSAAHPNHFAPLCTTPCSPVPQLMRSPAVAPAVSAVYTSGELGIAVLVPLVAHTPGGEPRGGCRPASEAPCACLEGAGGGLHVGPAS